MSHNAVRFLAELSQDPVSMEDYWKDPDSFLAAADLTAEEKEVLRSGDAARLEGLLGRSSPLLMSQIHFPNPFKRKPKPKPKPASTPAPAPKPAPKPKPKPAPKPAPKPKPKSKAA